MNDKYLVPAVDIYETEDKYILYFDMPGVTKENIEVTSSDGTLFINGKVDKADNDWKLISSEFRLYDYKREIAIGNKVDIDKIEASYENGILKVELGKSEQAKPRKIEVKVA